MKAHKFNNNDAKDKGPRSHSLRSGKDLTPMTADEVESKILSLVTYPYDPRHILTELGKLLPVYLHGPAEEKEKSEESVNKHTQEALMALGTESHLPLAISVSERFRPFAIAFIRQLREEYSCTTVSEKALGDATVNAYIRVLEFSSIVHRMTTDKYTSGDQNGFYGIASKELDRAHRQFVTALTLLKQFKNPPVDITVKAKAAFIAQNQQINATTEKL